MTWQILSEQKILYICYCVPHRRYMYWSVSCENRKCCKCCSKLRVLLQYLESISVDILGCFRICVSNAHSDMLRTPLKHHCTSKNSYGIRAKSCIPPSVNVRKLMHQRAVPLPSNLGITATLALVTPSVNIVNYETVVVARPTVVWRQQLRQYFEFMRATRNVINRIKNK